MCSNGFETVSVNPPSGMTLRDWFAGKALSQVVAGIATGEIREEGEKAEQMTAGQMAASQAYIIADAMIAEREKTK